MLIKLSCDGGRSDDEWCILEFQGELLGDMAPGAPVGDIIEIKVNMHHN